MGYSRKRGDPEEVVERYKRDYMDQKSKTAIMAQSKKSQWESKKIEETWKDDKTFWKMIAELVGKDKNGSEEAFIYTEEGEKKEIMNCRKKFMEAWTSKVYQKYRQTNTQIYRQIITQIYRQTNTQIYRQTNTQIYR